jgi:hypothetical protein
LFYDDPVRTSNAFAAGQVIAKISLPLTVLNQDGSTERAVPTVLQFKSLAAGGASCSVTGNFSGSGTQTLAAAAIGVNCAVVFGASPGLPHSHTIFEVAVPLVVTAAIDPAYPITHQSAS